MTSAPIVLAVVAAVSSLAAAGCHDQPTQVVLVVRSDLLVPSEVTSFSVTVAPGPFEPPLDSFLTTAPIATFPISVGIVSQGETPSFSLVARLVDEHDPANFLIVVSKMVIDVRFVPEQTLMLLLDLPRSCACEGTSCPLPGDPLCDKITQPALVPFDAALAPAVDTAPRFAAAGSPQ